MRAFFNKLKASTKTLLAFLLFGPISLTQIQAARDFIMPRLVHHPKVTGVLFSVFCIIITLHRPQVQKFLQDQLHPGKPLVPAEPGKSLSNVEVVTDPQSGS